MFVKDILEELKKDMPFYYACDWDNIGLTVGDENLSVKNIVVCLDITNKVIDEAVKKNADLIVAHHPLMFAPVKRINTGDLIGRRIINLIKNNISCISMHTNYDVADSCMADIAADKLELDNKSIFYKEKIDLEVGLGKKGNLREKMSLADLAKKVKETFSLDKVIVHGDLNAQVYNISILPGSGKNMSKIAIENRSDVFITGDITHHEALDAVDAGLAIIDASHYGIEKVFIDDMAKRLELISGEYNIYKCYEEDIYKFI